jgi:acyl-CoA hydrolase
VVAERWSTTGRSSRALGEQVMVTEAEVVLVAVDDQGRPTPIRPEPQQA